MEPTMHVNGRLDGGSKNAIARCEATRVPANAERVGRLLAWSGNFLNRGGADLALLLS